MHDYADASDRFELWERVLADRAPERVAEIGVFRGRFAARALAATDSISTYYLLDPWRHLDDWDKPANRDDDQFAAFLAETMAVTEFAGDVRVVLRGTTTEVIDEIPDQSLDFAYIDGDHTLRGITIDMVKVWPKMKPGGLLCGDDLTPTIWQHDLKFEPTMVFPFVPYFAEAMGAPCWALPHHQFAIEVGATGGFTDIDGRYGDRTVRAAMRDRPTLPRRTKAEAEKIARRTVRRIKNRL